MIFATYGIIILGIFLGILGEHILERHDENVKRRMAQARTKFMHQFEDDANATAAHPDKSFLEEVSLVLCAEAPVMLVLVVLGAPIVYLEGWDWVMG